MPKVGVADRIWECLRCGHRWANRKPQKPICCAKCKSPYWDIPKDK